MKVINLRKEQLLIFLYLGIIIFGVVKSYTEESVETFSMPVSRKVIMIDAGHGGWDPGKVGRNETLEKDINLAIASKLQTYLEQSGSVVILSRSDDSALAKEKNDDLRGRTEIANTSKADIMVSIHQNSYPNPSVTGAQVFYYDDSEESKRLAESIQREIISFTDQKKNREAKANGNYFLLKKTKIPAVIVECGFLSSDEDRLKLMDEEYQEKMAWGIYLGIINYYSNFEKDNVEMS